MSRETAWSLRGLEHPLGSLIPYVSPPVASGEPYQSEDQTGCETKAKEGGGGAAGGVVRDEVRSLMAASVAMTLMTSFKLCEV